MTATASHSISRATAERAGLELGDHDLVTIQDPGPLGGLIDCLVLAVEPGGPLLVSHYGHRYRVPRSAVKGPFGPCDCWQVSAHRGKDRPV